MTQKISSSSVPEPSPSSLDPGSPSGAVIPARIGPYQIESLLRQGIMSNLYLGIHPSSKEPVAIKVLSPNYLSNSEAIKRFLQEAEIIRIADHPNIIKLYGQGEWEGGLYIAMEFIQGTSLRQYLLQTPLSLKKSLEMIIDIAYALCHLHTHGVIHRDLKPENILVTETGHVKVIDFGIAQLLAERPILTEGVQQRLMGTLIYMSPEQRENPEAVSYPSDIYSLGIICYELILGKLSHGQVHISLMPRGLQPVFSKSLQIKPEDRYQDLVDFITDVTSYLHSSNMNKEKKAGDYLSELLERCKEAQSLFFSCKIPSSAHVDLGIATYTGPSIPAVYFDALDMGGGAYAIVVGEPLTQGVKGILYTAMVKGIVRALYHRRLKCLEIIGELNNMLVKEQMDAQFRLSSLLVSPKEEAIRYISFDYSTLWHVAAGTNVAVKITAEHPPLGVKTSLAITETTHPWKHGDRLILSSSMIPLFAFAHEQEEDQTIFRRILEEQDGGSAQKLADSLVRYIRAAALKQASLQPFLLLALQHVNMGV